MINLHSSSAKIVGLDDIKLTLNTKSRDPFNTLAESTKTFVHKSLEGLNVSDEEALAINDTVPGELSALCWAASVLRTQGKGHKITFSPKVFIPLTHLCRDFCSYCIFRRSPNETTQLFMTRQEVLSVALAGERLGCTEALFTLGERPEQLYPEAKSWLSTRGYSTTLEYLYEMSSEVLKNTSMLPHGNPGTMSSREMAKLRTVNASMGAMLESVSERLREKNGPHHNAPSKWPKARLKTLENAGKLGIPFTTGILVGIGETFRERIEALLAIKRIHHRYGHIQEVIIQNFRPKANTPMANHASNSLVDLLRTVALARLILGPAANIQVPPNLNPEDFSIFLLAGINDWGGISPLTIDYVNPEAPWPSLKILRRLTDEYGFELIPRLPIYPEYLDHSLDYLKDDMKERIRVMADSNGYVKGGMNRFATTHS